MVGDCTHHDHNKDLLAVWDTVLMTLPDQVAESSKYYCGCLVDMWELQSIGRCSLALCRLG
jgi:hypothetical protein